MNFQHSVSWLKKKTNHQHWNNYVGWHLQKVRRGRAVGRDLSLEQCFPTSSWNMQGVLMSSALLMMPLKSANVSSSCISRMGCLDDSYRWRSSRFWYYNVYTPATCSSIWEMQHLKWVQVGNQKTEQILLKALSKSQLQIMQQLVAVVFWHPIDQHFPESKARLCFYPEC